MEKQSSNESTVKIPISNDPKDVPGKIKKRPFVLTACLITDSLCFLLTFSIIILLANDVPRTKGIKTNILPGKAGDAGEKIMDQVRIAFYYGIVSTSICFLASMFLLIYTLVVLFGDKVSDFLAKEIGKELGLLDSTTGTVNDA